MAWSGDCARCFILGHAARHVVPGCGIARAIAAKALNDRLTLGEKTLQLLTRDPHSPRKFRVNGAVVNHDGFHGAPGTQPADKLFKPMQERIRSG